MRISSFLLIFALQNVPVLSGGVTMDSVTMDSVYPPPNIVMGTGSVLMAVMNSTAVYVSDLSPPRAHRC